MGLASLTEGGIFLEFSYYFRGRASEVAIDYFKAKLYEALETEDFEVHGELHIGRWANGGFAITLSVRDYEGSENQLEGVEGLLGRIRKLLEKLNFNIETAGLIKLDGSGVEAN